MSGVEFSRQYTTAALTDACQRIAGCPRGQGLRNKTLNREIYSVARLIGSTLSADEIMAAGITAATANGYLGEHGQAATAAIIQAAIEKGQRSPRTAPLNKYEVRKAEKRPAAPPINQPVADAVVHHPGSHGIVLQSQLVDIAPYPRTPPDARGKPYFAAGDTDGPPQWKDELRRHAYRRDARPVRVKVKRTDGGFVNWYRVVDSNGSIGWQTKEPAGYVAVPYTGPVYPFDPELHADVIYWPEGERDVDTLAKLDLLAFTFGGTGDGLPAGIEEYLTGRHIVILADNDQTGRDHAKRKAAIAHPVSASVRIVHFPSTAEKGDVSDWIAGGKTADDLVRWSDAAPLWTPPDHPVPVDDPASAPLPTEINSKPGVELVMVCMADVRLKPIDWLWNKRIALGKVTVLAGDGGLGKSTILCDLASRTTTGEHWPDGERNGATGNVIILAAEDALDDTLGPRLRAAGADMQSVFSIPSVKNEDQSRRSFSLKADLQRLEQKIAEIGGARLIIIDPISSYLGGVDSHKNAEVRSVLEPLGEMASRLNVAVICNNHFSKGGGGANSRIIGSVAFVNQARSAFIVTQDADDPDRRLFMPSKSNIAVLGSGLSYRIGSAVIDCDGLEILTSRIYWETAPVTMSADAALAALGDTGEARSSLEEAKEWLADLLASGSLDQKEVKQSAEGAGLSWATVRRAKQALSVTARRDGYGGGGKWLWELGQPKVLKTSIDAHASDVSTFEKFEHL